MDDVNTQDGGTTSEEGADAGAADTGSDTGTDTAAE